MLFATWVESLNTTSETGDVLYVDYLNIIKKIKNKKVKDRRNMSNLLFIMWKF